MRGPARTPTTTSLGQHWIPETTATLITCAFRLPPSDTAYTAHTEPARGSVWTSVNSTTPMCTIHSSIQGLDDMGHIRVKRGKGGNNALRVCGSTVGLVHRTECMLKLLGLATRRLDIMTRFRRQGRNKLSPRIHLTRSPRLLLPYAPLDFYLYRFSRESR